MRFSSSEALGRLFAEAKSACSSADDFNLLAASEEDGIYSASFHASEYDFTVVGRGNVVIASLDRELPRSSAKEIANQVDAASR